MKYSQNQEQIKARETFARQRRVFIKSGANQGTETFAHQRGEYF